MLPKLRIKEDKFTTIKNATVMPPLIVGVTFSYKHIVLQISGKNDGKSGKNDGKSLIGSELEFKL